MDKINPKVKYIITAVSAAVIMYCLAYVLVHLPKERDNQEQVAVTIQSGWGLHQAADAINDAGLLSNKYLLTIYVGMRGREKNIKAGKYIFSKSMNIVEIATKLENGLSESSDLAITIPEGLNIWEIDNLLVKMRLISEGQFSGQFKDDEGYLFPDTYRLQDKNDGLLQEMREKMSANFNSKTEEIFRNLADADKAKAIITASILEKEARSEEDMRLVAGIIYKRLELKMPLQVDASVIYGACRRKAGESNFTKNCDVTFQGPAIEIKIDGPYNTYTRTGLPSAPISSPGMRAIRAALNPQKSDYLYYLSTRDGSQMIYSKTPAEHMANRRKYLGI